MRGSINEDFRGGAVLAQGHKTLLFQGSLPSLASSIKTAHDDQLSIEIHPMWSQCGHGRLLAQLFVDPSLNACAAACATTYLIASYLYPYIYYFTGKADMETVDCVKDYVVDCRGKSPVLLCKCAGSPPGARRFMLSHKPIIEREMQGCLPEMFLF